jgi:hypothetical protein
VRYDPERRKYVVRWRENNRQRVKRFDTPEAAEAFERSLRRQSPATESQGPGVAALAARLAQLEAQLAATPEEADARPLTRRRLDIPLEEEGHRAKSAPRPSQEPTAKCGAPAWQPASPPGACPDA